MYLPCGTTYWAAADETRGGVAIAVRSGRGIQVTAQGQDAEGRFIWIKVKRGDEEFGVCNVYAPCNIRERKELWGRMQTQLDPAYKWMVGGDLNFIEELTDKSGGIPPELKHVSVVWHDLRDIQLLVYDPWVIMPAQKKRGSLRVSWTNQRENLVELIGCRPDRIYIPMGCVDRGVLESYQELLCPIMLRRS